MCITQNSHGQRVSSIPCEIFEKFFANKICDSFSQRGTWDSIQHGNSCAQGASARCKLHTYSHTRLLALQKVLHCQLIHRAKKRIQSILVFLRACRSGTPSCITIIRYFWNEEVFRSVGPWWAWVGQGNRRWRLETPSSPLNRSPIWE